MGSSALPAPGDPPVLTEGARQTPPASAPAGADSRQRGRPAAPPRAVCLPTGLYQPFRRGGSNCGVGPFRPRCLSVPSVKKRVFQEQMGALPHEFTRPRPWCSAWSVALRILCSGPRGTLCTGYSAETPGGDTCPAFGLEKSVTGEAGRHQDRLRATGLQQRPVGRLRQRPVATECRTRLCGNATLRPDLPRPLLTRPVRSAKGVSGAPGSASSPNKHVLPPHTDVSCCDCCRALSCGCASVPTAPLCHRIVASPPSSRQYRAPARRSAVQAHRTVSLSTEPEPPPSDRPSLLYVTRFLWANLELNEHVEQGGPAR